MLSREGSKELTVETVAVISVGGKEPLGSATNGASVGGALGATAASDGAKQTEGRRWAGGRRWASGEGEEEAPSEASSVVPASAAPPAAPNGAHLAVTLESGAKVAAEGEGGARRATQVPTEGGGSSSGELAATATAVHKKTKVLSST